MAKRAYFYVRLDECDPTSSAYHREGGLVVVTNGYPNDAVPAGTGNRYTVSERGEPCEKFGLPEATYVFDVGDDAPDLVLAFPDAGCC